MIYLDYAATTKPSELALEEYVKVARNTFGNPGSMTQSRELQERIRNEFLEILKFNNHNLIFTSGGTEANNLAILGQSLEENDEVITSSFEHASVFEPLKKTKAKIKYTKVNSNGYIDINDFKNNLSMDTKMVCIMHVNNELGTKQPIDKIVRLTRQYNRNIIIMIDGIQAVGKIDMLGCDADIYTFSSHKLYGPKAVGAVVIRKDIMLTKSIFGGTKELNMRAGTQSLPAQAGFLVATKELINNFSEISFKLKKIRNYLEVKVNESYFTSLNTTSDTNVISIRIMSNENVMKLIACLSEKDIYVSSKSADTDDLSVKSRSLKAIGLSDEICDQTLRVSFSHHTKLNEIDVFFNELEKIISK